MATNACPNCGAELTGPDKTCQCSNSPADGGSSKTEATQKKNRKVFSIIITAVISLVGLGLLLSGFFVKSADPDAKWVELRKTALEAYQHGELKSAEKKFFAASKYAKAVYGDNDPKYLDTLEKLAWVYEEQGRYAPARKLFEKIRNMSSEDVMHFQSAQISAYPIVAQMRDLTQNPDPTQVHILRGSQPKLRNGISALEQYLGPADPGLIVLYEGLAENCEKQKDFDAAEEARMKVLMIRENSQGAVSAGAAQAHVNLAKLYLDWGKAQLRSTDFEGAKQTFSNSKKSLESAKKSYEELFGKSDSRLSELPAQLDECTKLEQDAKLKAEQHPSPDTLPEYK